MAGSALRLLLALLCTALPVKSDQPGSLVSDDLAEEGYLLASDLFHLPAEGSGGGVEGSAEGSVDIEIEEEEEEEEDFPRLRNITIFPACIADDDCHKYFSADKVQEYKCFQYMCYPWKQVEHFAFVNVCECLLAVMRASDIYQLGFTKGIDVNVIE